MQINFKTIAAALAMITQLSAASAQESLNTAGGVDRGRGGSVSYSVGQLVYTTETTQAGAMAQGIQRPMENLAAGIYLLQVFDTNPNPLQTLQIIKN